MSNISRITLFV